MGRLLKKKSPLKKKKKPEDDHAAAGDADQNDIKAADASAEDASKKQPAVMKKAYVPAKPAATPVTGEKSFIQKSIQFLREVKAELKKVVWPSRKQTIGSTLVVIILVIIISFFLGLVDIGLSSLVRVVLQR